MHVAQFYCALAPYDSQNMIDLNYFQPNLRPRPAHLILAVGELIEDSGFMTLIAACRILADWGYDYFSCYIVGDGEARSYLLTDIRTRELQHQIRLLPLLPPHDLLELYHQATIFTLPCLALEGIQPPLPLLQAMATGLPVVSTNLPKISQVVTHLEDGLLVPAGDAVQLARILAALLQDQKLRLRLGTAARRKMEHLFG